MRGTSMWQRARSGLSSTPHTSWLLANREPKWALLLQEVIRTRRSGGGNICSLGIQSLLETHFKKPIGRHASGCTPSEAALFSTPESESNAAVEKEPCASAP